MGLKEEEVLAEVQVSLQSIKIDYLYSTSFATSATTIHFTNSRPTNKLSWYSIKGICYGSEFGLFVCVNQA